MYRVVHKPSGRDIIILDDRWRKQIQQLRALDKKDELVCPGCRQPVRVRAGEIKRWHFAHKHLQNCPFERESPELLKTRAVVYHWLVAKFGAEAVAIEKILDSQNFYRHIDCWVDHEGQTFAYWIFDRRLPPAERDNLVTGFKKIGVSVNWIFTINLLREDEPNLNDRLHLTTTERAFMSDSKLNMAWQTHIEHLGGSLHYLDADQELLTTYRNLNLVHPPQLFAGTRLQHLLREVLASKHTGEFIHPGEVERYQKRQQELDRQRRETEERLDMVQDFLRHATIKKSMPRLQRKSEPAVRFVERTGTCKFCGTVTSDWVTYFGETRECICRKCKDKASSI
jgi:hypothetical protein